MGLISKRQPQEEERGRKERNKERKERSRHRKLAGEPFTCQTPGSIVSGRHRGTGGTVLVGLIAQRGRMRDIFKGNLL